MCVHITLSLLLFRTDPPAELSQDKHKIRTTNIMVFSYSSLHLELQHVDTRTLENYLKNTNCMLQCELYQANTFVTFELCSFFSGCTQSSGRSDPCSHGFLLLGRERQAATLTTSFLLLLASLLLLVRHLLLLAWHLLLLAWHSKITPIMCSRATPVIKEALPKKLAFMDSLAP